MATIDLKRQAETFEKARSSLSDVLDSEMLAWDYRRMLQELRKAIDSVKGQGDRNPIRTFARKYFRFQGSKYKDVTAWLTESKEMSFDETALALRTIREIKLGAPKHTPQKNAKATESSAVSFGRAAVENVMGQLNIARALLKAAGADRSHAFDGDRMILKKNIKAICERLGIDVRFPKTRNIHDRPVTDKELSLG